MLKILEDDFFILKIFLENFATTSTEPCVYISAIKTGEHLFFIF